MSELSLEAKQENTIRALEAVLHERDVQLQRTLETVERLVTILEGLDGEPRPRPTLSSSIMGVV